MAIRYAIKSGNWSDPTVWNGGLGLPGVSDDVYPNGFNVTIQSSDIVTVSALRAGAATGVVGGGVFYMKAGCTINANIYGANGYNCCHGFPTSNNDSAISTIVGNIYGGTGYGCQGVSTRNLNMLIIGNIFNAGSAYGVEIYNDGPAKTVEIIGNIYADISHGVSVGNPATLRVTGDCYGPTGAQSVAGVSINSGAAVLEVFGAAIGRGSNNGGAGVHLNAFSSAFVQIAKSNDFPNGVGNFQCGVYLPNTSTFVTVDSLEYGSGGWFPVYGRHFIRSAGTNYVKMRESNNGSILSMGEISADYPTINNVRNGISFDFGTRIGTLKVPPVGAVALGVETDNTTGTAALTPEAILGADLLTRLQQCATVATTGAQIAAMGGA